MNAGVEGLEGERVLEVNVGDERDRRVRDDVGQGRGGLAVRDGDTDDLAADVGELLDLGEGGFRVAGVSGRHRLDADRVLATDSDVANMENAGLAAGSDE